MRRKTDNPYHCKDLLDQTHDNVARTNFKAKGRPAIITLRMRGRHEFIES
jgi:hypothetical protein